MAKINILPAKVFNRIAAGEVVDRPYSVAKELVENAIDAGATEIQIHIEKGGKQLIRVVDNGCGIERDDLHSAFLPHATSKIAKAEDLDNILTLGFRGEAVASIAAVSKMTITSKTLGGKCYQLTSDGGELGDIQEVAGENGTDVCVEMLFYNTPVRLKFLKSEKVEETDITNFVSRFILSKPDIAFTYYVNGKKVLQSFGEGMEEALVSVYGAAILSNVFQIDTDKHGVRIRGYIGNQNFSKPNKSYQSVFLNGRYIINATVAAALTNAYSSYLMKRQYPFYVLYIDVPTEIVDVNVHPNKADVRFADNQIMYGCIYSVISAVLDGHTKALDYIVQDKTQLIDSAADVVIENNFNEKPVVGKPAQEVFTQERVFTKPAMEDKVKDDGRVCGIATLTYEEAQREIENCTPKLAEKRSLPFEDVGSTKKRETTETVQTAMPEKQEKAEGKQKVKGAERLQQQFPDLFFERHTMTVNDPQYEQVKANEEVDFFAANKKFLEEMETKAKQNKIDVATCVYAGKLFNTYLLYECKDEIFIIDQHAAHERLIFNRLKEQMQNRAVVQQPMLIPFQLNLNAFESAFISERLTDIQEMGFDIEEFGVNSFRISAVPVDLQNINLTVFFNDILGDVSGYRSIKLADILKDKLASAACKAAVKGGMDLTRDEIDALFEMMDGDMGLKCPHGRPVVVKMTRTELEKMFKRIV